VLPADKKSGLLRSRFNSERELRARARAEETMVGIFSRFSAGAHRRSKSVAVSSLLSLFLLSLSCPTLYFHVVSAVVYFPNSKKGSACL